MGCHEGLKIVIRVFKILERMPVFVRIKGSKKQNV